MTGKVRARQAPAASAAGAETDSRASTLPAGGTATTGPDAVTPNPMPANMVGNELSLRSRAWRVTLLLALALSLAALGALGVDRVLRWSLRSPTVGDEASAACAYLLNGNYAVLAGEMDPVPDGASTGPFDRATFTAGLRALDARDGRVTSCALRQMGSNDSAPVVIFAMTVRRAHLSYPLGSLVVVRHEADGRWLISRASTFYYELG